MSTAPAPSQDEILHRNFRHLYADILWYGVLAGSALAFLSVYATRIGASGFQIGLLTAGPAVVNLLISIPAGRWLEFRSRPRATFTTSVWHRLGYPALIPIAWLMPAEAQVWALPLLVMLISVPGTALAIAFNAMFADVVPPEYRGQVVGRRNALLAISLTVSTLLSGWLLEAIAFPLNYEIVFAIGAVGAGLSSYYLMRIEPLADLPPRVGQPLLDGARPGLFRFADAMRPSLALRFLTRSAGRTFLRTDLLRTPFGTFLTAYFLFYMFQYLPIPVSPIYWVRHLHLSDFDISLGHAMFYGTMSIASVGMTRIARSPSHRSTLVAGGILYCLYPLLTGLANDATLFWAASLIGGVVFAVLNSGLVNRLMERVPLEDLPAHMALHNIALNLGILAGSFMGPVLGDMVGLKETLLISAGLRLLAGLLLAKWG